jgi:hypothetical protein
MTPAAFLKLALSLPETTEGAHMGHSDLRVAGKIFSSRADRPSLGKKEGAAYLKLTPEQQAMLCAAEPGMFSAVPGGWGLMLRRRMRRRRRARSGWRGAMLRQRRC